jgi:hypothetical protein
LFVRKYDLDREVQGWQVIDLSCAGSPTSLFIEENTFLHSRPTRTIRKCFYKIVRKLRRYYIKH